MEYIISSIDENGFIESDLNKYTNCACEGF
jgi:hypothetical protein